MSQSANGIYALLVFMMLTIGFAILRFNKQLD